MSSANREKTSGQPSPNDGMHLARSRRLAITRCDRQTTVRSVLGLCAAAIHDQLGVRRKLIACQNHRMRNLIERGFCIQSQIQQHGSAPHRAERDKFLEGLLLGDAPLFRVRLHELEGRMRQMARQLKPLLRLEFHHSLSSLFKLVLAVAHLLRHHTDLLRDSGAVVVDAIHVRPHSLSAMLPLSGVLKAGHEFGIETLGALRRRKLKLGVQHLGHAKRDADVGVFFHTKNLHQNSVTPVDTTTVSHLHYLQDTISMSQQPCPVVRLQLRLPSDLAEHLRQQAALNHRSLNNEMVSQLEQHWRTASDAKAKKVKG